MITRGEDVEASALRQRGWPIAAIARHLGRDRKTVRAHLRGDREAGVRQRAKSDRLGPFVAYLQARFNDNAHIWGTALYDEVVQLGCPGSYPSFARQLRRAELRPHSEACAGVKGREYIEIAHPPGEEIQWDWLELSDTPWGQPAYLLVGALSHSGRFRAVFCEQMTFGHLAGAAHDILLGLGGSGRVWRVDRMATAVIAGTDRLNPQFAQMAKHYGIDVAICPAHRPQRKGVVEAAIKFIGGRWWRTAQAGSMREAQQSLDKFTLGVSDRRGRRGSTVGELGSSEPLRALPALAFPAEIVVERVCSRSALVTFETNHYSVPPGYASQPLTVRARVGEPHLRIMTATGIKVATHRRAPAGAEQTVRTSEHATALERAVLDAFTTQTTCRRKTNRPPGRDALAELAKLHGHAETIAPVVSLADYAALAQVAC